ncbi:MAG: hypothetical protein JSV09_16625 [Thermoplasmata archaeon]|nr:MAG: hypothetical protein JSV09_16625 [Thermoplasmata archaeon]
MPQTYMGFGGEGKVERLCNHTLLSSDAQRKTSLVCIGSVSFYREIRTLVVCIKPFYQPGGEEPSSTDERILSRTWTIQVDLVST